MDEIASASKFEQLLNYVLTTEIPALYYLIERFAFLGGLLIAASALFSLYRVRALTGNYSMMSMQMADVSWQELTAKCLASIFLSSFGVGQAMISNTLFLQTFEPYSMEVIQSISCASGDNAGCIHYELGMFGGSGWMDAAINKTFFEFSTGVVAIIGTVYYCVGWFNFSKIGSANGGKAPRSFWACVTQIGCGAALMRPTETYLLLTGG